MKYYRMQQILLDPHPYAPAVLDRIFADLSGVGCNSILLEYHATFPYQGILSSAVRSNAYTSSLSDLKASSARKIIKA